MLGFIYDWIENIAFYLIILVAVMHTIPHNSYQKYIRFFAGLILILMISGPILKLFDMETYHTNEYKDAMRNIEEATGYMEAIIGEESELGE